MSKPWFLESSKEENGEKEELRETIRGVLGRDLGDAGGVKKEADREGKRLDEGEGIEEKISKVAINGVSNGTNVTNGTTHA